MVSERPAGAWDRVEAARLLLNPSSIAVVGATEDRGKFGGRLCGALVDHGYPGRLYPINPRRKELLGRPAYPSVASLPETPDLVLIVLPPQHAKAALEECAARCVPAAIVIASGFAEAGEEGGAYQAAFAHIARTTGPRLVGPNCLGVVNTIDRVAACATIVLDRGPMLSGGISMVSHSGALMMTMMNRAQDQGIGFRYMVSGGNEVDLDVCDFMEVFLQDPETRAIALFLEHIRRPARFRELAMLAQEIGKPIVALKVGRSEAGVRAARSHTAAIAGNDAVVDAVLKADGVIRVSSLEMLVSTANALAVTPRPRGQKTFIISGSGGACGLLADLSGDVGLQLAQLGTEGRMALEKLYEPAAIQNPLDLGGMRSGVPLFHPDSVEACVKAVASDPAVDGLLIGLMTQPDSAESMRRVASFAKSWGKPLVVYAGVGSVGQEALDITREAGLPLVADAEQCIKVTTALMRQAAPPLKRGVPRGLRPVPALPSGEGALTEVDSKKVLSAWGLPVPAEVLATSPEEVDVVAARFGGPVAMKVVSPDIPHKTEVHGVELGVAGREEMRAAFGRIIRNVQSARPEAEIEGVLIQEMVSGVEVIVGSKRDSQFGPVVLVGLGGVFVELLKDVAMRPAPVSVEEALAMLTQLKGYPLLNGFRGAEPADVAALAETISSFSDLAYKLADQVDEIDLNPVMVLPKGQGVRIVDALIVPGSCS
jgi:acyl-CoA synthetase (NDP forming)